MVDVIVEPDGVLRAVCNEVTSQDSDVLIKLVENMLETMYANDGVGLAAPQIGVSLRVVVIDASAGEDAKMCRVMCNPVVVSTSNYQDTLLEGCLSLPKKFFHVKRPVSVRVKYQTLSGDVVETDLSGFEARIAQHEIDHLDGVLISDNGKRATLR